MKQFATAIDGTVFSEDSFEVKEYLKKYPDVNIEPALGSVVMEYNKMFDKIEEVEEAEIEEVE